MTHPLVSHARAWRDIIPKSKRAELLRAAAERRSKPARKVAPDSPIITALKRSTAAHDALADALRETAEADAALHALRMKEMGNG